MTRSKGFKFFIIVSFVLFLFQSPLGRSNLPSIVTLIVNSYDELVALFFAVVLIVRCFSVGFPKTYLKELMVFFLFVVIGLICTILHHLQPINAVIEDLMNCSKFMLTYLGLRCLYKQYRSADILGTLQKVSKYIICVIFALTVIDFFFPSLLFDNTAFRFRYGLHTVHLFYYHPAVLAQVMVLLISVISFDSKTLKHTTILKILCLVVLASTLRTKALGFICFYLFLWGFETLRLGKTKALLVLLAILAIGFVASDSLGTYYGNKDSARARLSTDAISIANANAPLGLGYATFGSASAAKYYSPVYPKLGYLSRNGLGYISTSYLTDTFWPTILGQFGYFGLLAYGSLVGMLVLRAIRLSKRNKNAGIAVLSLVGYLLISSTAATAFFNPISIPNAFVIVLGLNIYEIPAKQPEMITDGENNEYQKAH